MKLPLTLATVAAAVLALAAVSLPAKSEVTGGQAAQASTGSAAPAAAGNWSAALEKSGPDTGTTDLSKDLSAEARILNEHLANSDKSGQLSDAKKADAKKADAKTAVLPEAKATSAKGATDKPDDWGSVWANKIRDFFRPIHKEVVNSEVAQAARELDSLIPKKSSPDEPPPIVVPPTVSPRSLIEPRQRDKNADAIAVEEFINEVKPYAYSALALAIVGYLGMVTWRFLRWKQVKSGKRIRRARAARNSRGRSQASGIRGDDDSPASRSGALASRASALQTDTQSDRLSL